MSNDPSKTKRASGISVFILEELGDARLRCAQLKKYIDEAQELINKSGHKDHFFEVASHLLYGIPDTLVRMDKALSAAALAASKLDYEEIKDTLRPEKVEELEEALKDVRIRRVKKQSAISIPEAATRLKNLAQEAEVTGQVDIVKLASFVTQLEGVRVETEDGIEIADLLRRMSTTLLSTRGPKPSRLLLASALRRVLGNTSMVKTAANYPTLKYAETKDCDLIERLVNQRMAVDWVVSPKERLDRQDELPSAKKEFDAVNELISEATERLRKRVFAFEKNGLPEFEELGYSVKLGKFTPQYGAPEWSDYVFKQECTVTDKVNKHSDEMVLIWEFRSQVRVSAEHNDWTYFNSNSQGSLTFAALVLILHERTRQNEWIKWKDWRKQYMSKPRSASDAKLSRFEEGKPADPTENMSDEDAEKWEEMNEKYEGKFKTAEGHTSEMEVESRFEEGKPADPTENMSEEDANKWKEMTEKYEDKFKSASSDTSKEIEITVEDFCRGVYNKDADYVNIGGHEISEQESKELGSPRFVPYKKIPRDAKIKIIDKGVIVIKDDVGGWIEDRLGNTLGRREWARLLQYLDSKV